MENLEDKEQYLWNFIFTVAFLILLGWLSAMLYRNASIKNVNAFDFIILILATFRLTHLFVYDYITNYLRAYFRKFGSGPGKTISNLLSCPWCTSIWMALLVSSLYFFHAVFWYPLFALALAGAGVWLEVMITKK